MLTINITTTSSRLELCSCTVWSLCLQTAKFDEIRIWVSKEPYLKDSGITAEPSWVTNIRKLGISISFIWTENTGPYRKIIPALRQADYNDVLVYADDDVFYGQKWLECLTTNFYANDCKHIVATRVRKVLDGEFYNNYPIIDVKETILDNYIITGIGGVILNASLVNCELLNNDAFLSVAPTADDIWLSKVYQMSGTPLTVVPDGIKSINEIKHAQGLSEDNTKKKKISVIRKIALKLRKKKYNYCDNDDLIIKVNEYFSHC
ncbi:hypothetical protein [Morganella morganii]|uniref:hypothetical protein n=1 Tax=Morganella morganii TaxID=582 RepID=UPI0004683115|nr:hypothetical protein [Morganella morganii]MCU6210199.1 hypothetical protein [Morganella morganii]MCU6234498.1 hypothetical protein [Morganella morganii]HAT1514550.1 hypothetical protein [Morganella morganii]